MKVGFFLLKFPLSSETFVLNQITAFIDMGFEVEIVALQKGDTQNTHAAWTKYNLAARTRWLQDEPTGKGANLPPEPVRPCAAFIVKIPGRRSTSNAMVPSRGT
ncbi:putative colanic acid biosynthesis glycosyltransferase wcaL [Escherichia coli 3-073-06_S4_C2]|nr:putative colanic acid biosynthesis glycosyltransferase wcaL [Escherichia coli 3-073-06_S4_C2]